MDEIERKFVEKVYDEIFDEASELFKKYPVCGTFDFGICRKNIATYDNETLHKIEKEIEAGKRKSCNCCNDTFEECPYVSETGCTTKNMSCKLFVCGWVMNKYKNNKKFFDSLSKLKEKINMLGIPQYRYFKSREHLIDITMDKIKNSNFIKNSWKDYKEKYDKH